MGLGFVVVPGGGVGVSVATQLAAAVFGSCRSKRANVFDDANTLTEKTIRQTKKKTVFFCEINIHDNLPHNPWLNNGYASEDLAEEDVKERAH
jgi:hypothetical protein